MIDLSNVKKYYIACGYTDLRRGIDGLAEIITLQHGYEIDENSLFLFLWTTHRQNKSLVVFGRWVRATIQAFE